MQAKKKDKLHIDRRRILFLCILCLFGFYMMAQVRPRGNAARQAKRKVYLLHADVLKKNIEKPDAQILIADVEFRHDSIYMYCDTAYFYEKANSLEAFGNFRMV